MGSAGELLPHLVPDVLGVDHENGDELEQQPAPQALLHVLKETATVLEQSEGVLEGREVGQLRRRLEEAITSAGRGQAGQSGQT